MATQRKYHFGSPAGRFLIFLSLSLFLGGISGNLFAEWRSQPKPARPGDAVELRSFEANFAFGWSELSAGEAKVRFEVKPDGLFQATARGKSTGLARTLWQLDGTYKAQGRSHLLESISFEQEEVYRRHRIDLEGVFSAEGAERRRDRRPSPNPPAKWKKYRIEGMRDLLATMLFIRSQPLRAGDEISLVCFPGTDPYLVKVKVEGRDKIPWQETELPCLRLSLQLQKIETEGNNKGEMTPHPLFRRATIWIADDDFRLPIRAEVGVFIGYIFLELQSWKKL